jgi:hypothetical protein
MDNRAAVGYVKTFVLGLVVATMLAQPGVSVAAASDNATVRDLASAKMFAFGGVGVAGITSEGERNLRAVLQQSDASQQLQSALAHATPAGKLYILVGLRRCDRPAYQKGFRFIGPPQRRRGSRAWMYDHPGTVPPASLADSSWSI